MSSLWSEAFAAGARSKQGGQVMRITDLLSALAENRSAFFRMIDQLESAGSCAVDVTALECLLDAHYSGRRMLTDQEAQLLLLAVAHYSPARRSD